VRVHVVSDVHGSAAALARAGDGADALVCLGDLLLFVDYDDYSAGIMGTLFGADAVRRFVELRTAQQYEQARAFSRGLWAGATQAGGGEAAGPDRDAVVLAAVRRQYAELFAAFPTPTYLTYGNVDLPALWPEFRRDGVHVLDGATTTLDGWTFGFVGGGLRSPMRTPYELSEEEYAAKVAAVGEVDVLCTHIPPAVPELTYDVVARRFERGSEAVLAAIRATRPRYVLFGHVHQPLQQRMRIGRTECVNVGHFRGRGTPYVLRW
jgi:Icc-related predicted phosphoesterase